MVHRLLLSIAVGLIGVACAAPIRAPVVPPAGAFFSDIQAPLTLDYTSTQAGSKRGEASTIYVQDPIFTGIAISWGDATIKAAARQGRITEIRYADYRVLRVLGFFVRYTTLVYGE
jgi:hypothetical protein